MRSLATLTLILLTVVSCNSQDKELRMAEDSLTKLLFHVHHGETDNAKFESNELLVNYLEKLLKNEKAFTYPFDSLKNMAKLTSPDGNVRIINWNLPLADGTYEYFGFLLVKGPSGLPYRVYRLTDKSAEIETPGSLLLPHDRWYGALYYKIIEHKHNGRKYYTLLGWDGNNLLTTKKIIEVLSFKSKGQPVFGSAIFRKYNDKEKPARIIFEYSSMAAMSLKFEKQYIRTIRQSRDRKNAKTVSKAEPMIVFDHLIPLDTRQGPVKVDLTGHFQFYVPETNVVDAFVLRDGRWYFAPDVDARNPKIPKRKQKKLPQPSDYFPQP